MSNWGKIQNQSVFFRKPKRRKGKNFTGMKRDEIEKILASDKALRNLVEAEKKKPVSVELRLKFKRKGKKGFNNAKWRELRYQALVKHGKKCMACNATDKPLHVDHILPKSKYPEFAYDLNNLQILCEDCNIGKSNKDQTDWRPQN